MISGATKKHKKSRQWGFGLQIKKKLKINKIPKWSRIASPHIDSIYGQCGFLSGSVVKNLLAMQEPQEMQVDAWARKIPWRRTGQQTAVSLLENPTDREAWQVTVHRVAKSQT